MDTDVKSQIERAFSSLPFEERETIIRYGVAFRLSNLMKRLFLAESKIRYFEEKYKTTLTHLDTEGLPDDATYEMHEDYIMWHHWAAVAHKVKQDIDSLQKIAQYGLPWEEWADVGH
ncbi:MAG: hypothetical protein HYS70_01495 [Nitrospinae bacterium]|nr:hypothetical protein [Nitrospinota bacterium]